ncbi:MAG: LegC family aminotransferase [Gemmatimonadota bacterium]
MNRASELSAQVTSALRTVIGAQRAVLHEPLFAGNEWAYVKDTIDSSFVSSVGAYVDRFERDLETFTGSEHVIVTGTGTAALHVALLLGGVRPGDEVLVPTLTFVATANAVAYCGATPHFIDVEEATLGVAPVALRTHLERIGTRTRDGLVNRETGRPIRAVVPMHAFGHPVDLDALLAVAAEFGIVVIEDAAESLGSTYHGRHTGRFGALGTLSFNGNKTITTGGGGAIMTGDPDLARRAKHLTTTGKLPHQWEYRHDGVAFNYRLPNLNAALGCAQLEQLPAFLDAKRRLTDAYASALASVEGVTLFREPEGCRSNYWLQTLLVDDGGREVRDAILAATHAAGYLTRPSWELLHTLEHFAGCPRADLSCSTRLSDRIVNLPSSPQLALPHHGSDVGT